MRSSPDRLFRREDKGVTVALFPHYVMKHYHAPPAHISAEEQARRLRDEIDIYKRLDQLECPFAPRLLGYSMGERKFFIARIEGEDLLSRIQKSHPLPVRSIVAQLDRMNDWLRGHSFPDMGNNCKDLILDPSGRLHLVDFECDFASRRPDLYNAIVNDLVQRLLRMPGKQGRLTREFFRLFLAVLRKRPWKTVRVTAYYVPYRLARVLLPRRRRSG